MKRIAVVGGGIAGVTAAYELSKAVREGADVEFVLFEQSNRLGGIVETVREGGFILEGGPDGWVTEKPWARELAEELGLGDELIYSNDETRKTYVLVDHRLRAIPDGMRMMVPSDLDALDASDLFSDEAKTAFREELGRAESLKAEAPGEDESIAAFVRRHFGDEVLEKIGAPLLSGVFGGDVAQLSVQAVMAPFVRMEREHGSLIAGLQSRVSEQAAPIFTTIRSGVGTLVERMIAAIPEESVRLGAAVKFVSNGDEGWLVGTAKGVERFDALMMSAPVDVAATLLRPVDTRAAELMEMDASSAVIVAFGFPDASKFSIPEGFGFLVPSSSEESLLLACTFVDQKFKDRVPQGGRLIRAFFGGAAAERMMRCGNDEAAAVARMELARILGPLPEPQITIVRRLPRSLPQYGVGHLERMAELDRRVTLLGELSLLGNGYRGVGLPDLVRDARDAVRRTVGKS